MAPISKAGDGTITYTPVLQKDLYDATGVIRHSEFAICDHTDVLKQVVFDASAQATNTKLTLKSGAQSSSITVTMPATSGTLAVVGGAGGNTFTIMQPDLGTSPTAASPTDTLTLTSSDSTITITGTASTDTINYQARVADATHSGIMSTGTQTIAGAKTFSGGVTATLTGNASTATTVTTNANLTGPITSSGNATSVAAQTGTGTTFVMQATPTLTTPVIGAATGTSLSVTGQLTSTVATGTAPLVVSSTTQVANLNAATAGSATNVTGTVAIANGGSGQTTATAAFDALAPNTTLGDVSYHNGSNNVRLAGNTTATKKFLRQTGTGSVSAAPAWDTIASGDVPTLNQNTTGTANNVTGTVAIANGGTGQTTAAAAMTALSPITTTGDIIYSSSGTTNSRLAIGTQEQVLATNSSGIPYWRDSSARSPASEVFDDFDGGSTFASSTLLGNSGFLGVFSGTGAALASVGSTYPGVVSLATGTTTTGFAVVRRAVGLLMGGGSWFQEWYVQTPAALSNATDEYQMRVGFKSNNSGEPTNGIYFKYYRSTTFTCQGTTTNNSTSVTGLGTFSGVIDATSIQATMAITGAGIPASTTVSSVNSGAGTLVLSQNATASATVTLTFTFGNFWVCECISASTASVQITSSAVVAATWYKPQITINAAGTSVTFALNGSNIATITTNIDTAVAIAPILEITKSAGTTTTLANIDYYYHRFLATTPR